MVENASFKFAFQLYQNICQKDFKNVFISPYSISAALSMVLLGSKGNTTAELLKGLGFARSADPNVVHKRQQELLQHLDGAQSNIILKIANKLFVEQSYQVAQKFLQESEQYYHTEAESLDFKVKFNDSRIYINKWIEEKTEQKITNLLPALSVSSFTRLVIANAIYFKGSWMNKFIVEHTHLSDFYVDQTYVAKVEMMSQEKKFNFGLDQELGVQVVSLPYKGEDVSMIILVPLERYGLKLLEEKLTYDKLKNLTSKLSKQKVILSMPKMKLEFSINLIPILQSLGIDDVFDVSRANLSGISGQQDLYVSGAFHKAFLEVNEEGSEAAAATALVVGLNSFSFPIQVTCDHPFMFCIMHNPTQSVLFMGRFVSPQNTQE